MHGPHGSKAADAGSQRFQAKHALGLDPRVEPGSREENAPPQKRRVYRRFHEAAVDSNVANRAFLCHKPHLIARLIKGCRGDVFAGFAMRAKSQAIQRSSEHSVAPRANSRNRCGIKESQMPKLKTKSGAKKRFKVTGTGKVVSAHAGKRHGMIKRTNNQIRNQRGTTILAECDGKVIRKSFLPNG
jgi:large subunit ribosomal protein L35